MNAQEIAPGLWLWSAFHPEWRKDVNSFALESADGLMLFDPLEPPARFLKPAHVVVTIYWHGRSTRDLRPKRIWAPSRSALPLRRRGVGVTDEVRPGDELPAGTEAHASGRPAELVYWIPSAQSLVAGDVLLGGPLRICPPGWVGKGGREAVREALRPLAELPVRRVLVGHGKPVLRGGRAALQKALG